MHIALSANGRRVSQFLSHPLDRLRDVAFGRGLRLKGSAFWQGQIRENVAGPGAEILGGEIRAADLAQVVIHIGGVDGTPLTRIVNILKQFLPGEVETGSDDARQSAILELDL